MKYAMGWSASICLSSPAANDVGVNWPELYALLSSAAVQTFLVPLGFDTLVAGAIPAGHKSSMEQHSRVATPQLVT